MHNLACADVARRGDDSIDILEEQQLSRALHVNLMTAYTGCVELCYSPLFSYLYIQRGV